MKKPFQFYLNKIWLLLIYLVSMFPILPQVLESVLMISLFIISLYLFIKEKRIKLIVKKDIIKVIIYAMFFILVAISLIYTSDLKEGFKYVTRTLPIIGFPIIFGIFQKNKLNTKIVENIFKIYISSILVGLLFAQIYLATNININSAWDYRRAFEDLTGAHGNYYSLWLAFAVLLLFTKSINLILKNNIQLALILVMILCYFIYWQIVIGARLSLFMTVILLFVILFTKIKSKKLVFVGSLAITTLLISLTLYKPNYFDRIKELSKYKISFPKGDYNFEYENISNEQIRTGIYFCSLGLIKESWLIGYGIGDVREKLNGCYKEKIDSNVYQLFSYNSHNQYFQIILSSGVFALVLFLMSLIVPIYVSVKKSENLYLMFSILFIFLMLTENLLSLHDGVLFYGFFNAVFGFSKLKVEK